MSTTTEFLDLRNHLAKVPPFTSDKLQSFRTMRNELAAELKKKAKKPTQEIVLKRAENREIERVKYEE